VQGRLVWLQESDDGEMGDSTKRGSWPIGFGLGSGDALEKGE